MIAVMSYHIFDTSSYFQDPFCLRYHRLCSISSRLLHIADQKSKTSCNGGATLHLQDIGRFLLIVNLNIETIHSQIEPLYLSNIIFHAFQDTDMVYIPNDEAAR